ncbi:MAG: RdgB/HAM1 family non-canonical purine NTP pyrophosphatase [Gammaproteobacteria bacterium]|nr:RdgB/HAM1 family non-canonical purine NTP pyrophosphatase [Gammaproteobacteria bacterium]
MKIVLATSNTGKINEFSALMSDLDIKIIPQSDFNVEDVEETGQTFVENAILKARHAAEKTGLAALGDDSGLIVDALGGKPGIFSARYAGLKANAEDNIEKLLTEMGNIQAPNRSARFVCVLVLFRYPHDPYPLICQASWEGEILFSPQGNKGFGYDPIFWVPTHQCASAELADNIKNQISHRAKAFQFLHHKIAQLDSADV